jgi:hypothetical protein
MPAAILALVIFAWTVILLLMLSPVAGMTGAPQQAPFALLK